MILITQKSLENILFLDTPKWVLFFGADQLAHPKFIEDFPCHSTWKRCKHSGHFSKFRNITGNFCIIKQKSYVIIKKL
jgi:hypothetical protein